MRFTHTILSAPAAGMRRATSPHISLGSRILLLAFVSGLNVVTAPAQIPNKIGAKVDDSSTARNDRGKNTGPSLSDREWLREIETRVDEVDLRLSNLTLQYQLIRDIGAFNGVPDLGIGDTDSQNSKDLVGRIFLSPFRYAGPAIFQNLGFGIAASSGNELGSLTLPALATYRTPGQVAPFQYRADGTGANTVIAAGRRVRISPQSYLNVGALGLLAEFVRSSQYVSRAASVAHLSHDAWQVAGSWPATGKKNCYKSVTPRRSFDPPAGAWGAVEITGRYCSLDLDSAAFPIYTDPAVAARSARTVGVGISWCHASTIKFVADYDRTQFVGAGVSGNRAPERFVSTRFQTGF